ILSNTTDTPVFTDKDDNASISYIGTSAANSWRGGTLNWSNSDEFDRRRPSKTLVDKLVGLNDPRLPVWIAPVENPWTTNPALNNVTVPSTDPNGFTYTSKWEYLDRSN